LFSWSIDSSENAEIDYHLNGANSLH